MNQPRTETYRAYEESWSTIANHPVRESSVPTEGDISLPMPTLRWGVPVYAVFAGPAIMMPPEPVELGTPVYWWALDARRLKLLAFAQTEVVPFADNLTPSRVTISKPAGSIAEADDDQDRLANLMDAAVPAFFTGEPGDPSLRATLLTELTTVHLYEAEPWYRALAPDWFAWLEASPTARR
jgi:hypothetical protein